MRKNRHASGLNENGSKCLQIDDTLGAFFTTNGSWFQIQEIMYVYEPWKKSTKFVQRLAFYF